MKQNKQEAKSARRGIRSRIYLWLMLFGAVLLAVLWLFQIVFLEGIYRGQRVRQAEETAETLARSSTVSELRQTAQRLAVENDVSVLLVDGEQNTLLSVEGTRFSMIHRFSAPLLRAWCEQARARGGTVTAQFDTDDLYVAFDNPSFMDPGGADSTPPPVPSGDPENPRVPEGEPLAVPAPDGTRRPFSGGDEEDGRERRKREQSTDSVRSIVLATPVTVTDDEGESVSCTLLLYTQINPISSTVEILRTELIMITGVVIVGMLGLAYVISNHVSRPIIETSREAKALARSSYTRPKHADDYREISELNTTLEKAAEELGRVEQLQHELIANISHDLRTPLTMIGGYAEAMRDIPDETTPENMQIIIDETERLSSLVNELLDFSRMQAGAVRMDPAPFDLTEEALAIVSRVGGMTAKDGYTIAFEPEEHVTVTADAARISQVIYNLLGNALTYTGADKRVTVTQTVTGDTVRLSIHDTGKGIPKDELPLIWNRYYRTRDTHRRAIIGSGLGLNIVHAILEQHHARCGVDSEEGKGSTFWFELKAETDPQA